LICERLVVPLDRPTEERPPRESTHKNEEATKREHPQERRDHQETHLQLPTR
jgi:hypothetical protein